jgi:hypothetical protein
LTLAAVFEENSLYFPCFQGIGPRRRVRRDCVRHHEVRANQSDFLRHRIARHSRGLRPRRSVCCVFSAVSAPHWRRERSKVSGGKFPFPELVFATGSSRVRGGAWRDRVSTSLFHRRGVRPADGPSSDSWIRIAARPITTRSIRLRMSVCEAVRRKFSSQRLGCVREPGKRLVRRLVCDLRHRFGIPALRKRR